MQTTYPLFSITRAEIAEEIRKGEEIGLKFCGPSLSDYYYKLDLKNFVYSVGVVYIKPPVPSGATKMTIHPFSVIPKEWHTTENINTMILHLFLAAVDKLLIVYRPFELVIRILPTPTVQPLSNDDASVSEIVTTPYLRHYLTAKTGQILPSFITLTASSCNNVITFSTASRDEVSYASLPLYLRARIGQV